MTFIKAKHPDCQTQQHERFLGQIEGKFFTCCYTCGMNEATLDAVDKMQSALTKVGINMDAGVRKYLAEEMTGVLQREEG